MSQDAIKDMVNRRYRTSALVSDYFPLRIRNGAVMRGFDARCGTCSAKVLRGMIRGEVRSAPGGAYRVTAIGRCTSCNDMTSFLFHIIPEGEDGFRIVNMAPRGWPERYECQVVVLPVQTVEREPQVLWDQVIDTSTPSS